MTGSSLPFIVICLVLHTPNARLPQAVSFAGAQHDQTVTGATKQPTTSVTGIVVALGGRVVRADGRCRQLMVVRTTRRGNVKLNNTYLLVPRNYDCDAADFTNEMFQKKRNWRFPLVRGSDCDHTFEQIRNLPSVNPGGQSGSIPWLKIVPGNDGEKMSPTQKLLCYELNGEIKPVK